MVQLLHVDAGNITLKNTSGDIVFDSDERLFQATARVTGTKTVGGWTATFTASGGGGTISDVNIDVLHSLTSIDASCDTVVGALKATSSNPGGITSSFWYTAGGTLMYYSDAAFTGTRSLAQEMAAFTFVASGGTLYLHERVVLRAISGIGAPTNSITLLPVTFDYHLYVGSFV